MANFFNSYVQGGGRGHFNFTRNTAFKNYNRYHCGGDTLNFISGNTFISGGGCGGHGSFWSGLGRGLGAGLGFGVANMFGGFFGGGFGMPGIGGSWNFGGGWGGNTGWNPWASQNQVNPGNNNSCNCKCGNTNTIGNKDTSIQAGYIKDLDALKEKAGKGEDVTKEAKALKDKIVNSNKNHADEANKDGDKIIYDNLIKDCDRLIKGDNNGKVDGNGDNDGKVDGNGGNDGNDGKVDNNGNNGGKVDDNGKVNGNGNGANDGKVTIGGKAIKPEDIKIDDLNGLTQAEVNNIEPKVAEGILKKLGYIDDNGLGKLSKSYPVLMLLARSGVNVNFEHNDNAVDKDIIGKISNVQDPSKNDGKLAYTINCETYEKSQLKGQYRIVALDNTNAKFKIDDKHADTKCPDGYSVKTNGNEFTFIDEMKPLINNTSYPAVSKY